MKEYLVIVRMKSGEKRTYSHPGTGPMDARQQVLYALAPEVAVAALVLVQ